MDAFRSGLAARIKDARKKAGVKQSELAEICGVEVNTISRYETGVIAPSIEQLITIAKALDISAISLVSPLSHKTEDNTEQSFKLSSLGTDKFEGSEIAQRIKRQRQFLGIKQVFLARQVGINNSTLSSYENGTTQPNVEQLLKISEALQIPIEELAPSLDFKNSAIAKARAQTIKLLFLITNESSFIRINNFVEELIEDEKN